MTREGVRRCGHYHPVKPRDSVPADEEGRAEPQQPGPRGMVPGARRSARPHAHRERATGEMRELAMLY